MTDWLKHINDTYKYLEERPELVAFIVRDWPITQEAELADLAWAMCRDGYVTANDAKFLLDELKKFAESKEEE